MILIPRISLTLWEGYPYKSSILFVPDLMILAGSRIFSFQG